MADNAAQAIKDLQKNLSELDVSLDKTIKNQEKYTQGIAQMFQEAAKQGMVSVDNLLSYIGKQTKSMSNAMKIKWQIDLGTGKKGELEQQIANLKNDITKYEKSKDTHAVELLKQQLKDLEAEYKSLADASKKSAAQMYDDMLKIVNVAAGGKKDNKGTAWSQARARLDDDRRKTIDNITKAEEKIVELQEKLGKYKEGSKNWEKTNQAIEKAKSSLQQYQDKLNRLQGRKVEDASAKAIKDQVTNMRELYNLNKQYQQMLGKKRQGLLVNPQDLDDTKRRLREILDVMKKIETEHPGSRKTAAARLETERLRDRWKEANRETKANRLELDKMLPTLQRLASAFGIAFSIRGLAQFGKKLIETRGEFEMQQVALRSILQNKQLADEIWDKTMRAALQSPYTAMQLTKYTKQLAAYRIETEKLFDTTKRLADVSAGLGVDMQRLILAYGQVKAANYLRASEIRQFTEAGVNILGELSQYFTEAKGEMVSTAQVMDMVQKRMVRFEDVAEIFKRMTDQGGIFYNMQYVQSQTVKGQLMKLRDAYDQMLNTIGKGNEGTIKNLVSALNDIVRNWRTVAIVLKSIGWGVAINWVGKYVLALRDLSKASKATAANLVKFRSVLSSLSGFITLPTVIVGIATALLNMSRQMRAVNKEIDEQNYHLYESQKYFEELRYKIQLNNSYIEDETSSEEENTKAKEANRAIMQKLINEYPQLAAQMEISEDGLITMNDALDANIRKLKEQRVLINAMKTQSMFSDTDQKNLSDWEMKLSSIRVKMSSVQSEAERLVSAMETNNLQGTKLYEIYTKIAELDIANDALGAARSFEEMAKAIQNMPFEEFDKLNDELKDFDEYKLPWFGGSQLERKMGLGHALLPWSGSFEMYDMWGDENRAISALDNIQSELMRYYRNGIQDNEEYLEEVGDMTTEEFLKWLVKNAGRLNKDTAEGINKANEIFIKTLAPQSDEMKSYLNKYFNNLLGIDEMAFVRAEARLGWLRQKVAEHEALPQLGMLENPDRIAEYEAILQEIKELESFLKNRGIDFFATAENIGGTTEPDFELNAANLRKQVNLLEEMKKRYDELSKSAYGYAKSEAKVRQAFEDSFKEIFKGTGITMDMIDFTSMEGLSASIQKALDAATNIKDEVKQEVMKKIDSYEARIEIDAQVKIREDFAKDIEKMFNNYDLTVDLEKLNLPAGELAGIFKYDVTTVDMLRKAVNDFYDKQVNLGDDPKKLTEQVQKFRDKIDDMERKALVNRLKTYTAYLEKGRDEAVKIHLDELKKMAELDALYNAGYYTDTQYNDIKGKIKKETDESLAKKKWEDFKKSDFYIMMFQDLNNVADVSIDIMIEKLNALKEEVKRLNPKQVKEIVKTLDKLEKTKRSRSLFGTFKEDKELKKTWQAGNRDEMLPYWEQQEMFWQQMHDYAANDVAKLQEAYDILSHDGIEGNEKVAKKQLDNAQKYLDTVNEKLEESKENIEEITEEQNEGYAAWVRYHMGVAKGAQDFSNAAQAAGTIATEMMDMFDKADNASKKLAHDLVDIAVNAGLLVADIAKAISSKGTDIGAMVDGLIKTWNIIKSGISASERDLNRTIDDNKLKLEELEITLGRVEKAREKAWDTQSAVQASNEMNRIIKEQKKAYQALIAAENAKKSTDEDLVRQYERAIDELDEALEEEKDKMLELFGGLGENAYRGEAQNFVDAWKSAFLETGDGLHGLQDHFDEFLQEWFVKQATMRIAGRMLQPLFEQIDRAVDQYNAGGTSVLMSELNAIREKFGIIAPQLSDALEALAGQWGLDGEGGLSGLAAGIQGMTEEQANILEAYWNSVRGYTASIDMNVSRIADMLGAGTRDITNPQLQQLQLIAANAQATHQLLLSTSKSGHPMGGYGFKVFND